jgi:nicotinamidase-related amidase
MSRWFFFVGLAAASSLVCVSVIGSASAATITDEWTSVRPPPAPALAAVTVNPKTTALLVLDIVRQRCTQQDRPRCIQTVGPVQHLINEARKAKMAVVYSLIPGAVPGDVLPPLAPVPGDPIVTASADKFLGTDLVKILHDRAISTVVIVGTAAEGAVLATASEATMRGLQVVVPVDGMSSVLPYAEQYTAWHLMNAPGPVGHVTLTTSSQVHLSP